MAMDLIFQVIDEITDCDDFIVRHTLMAKQ
jgi:hypothetical protein